jgi:mono/diheme cytochrome c family protein
VGEALRVGPSGYIPRRMATLVFVLVFVSLGLGTLLTAMSGGRRGLAAAAQSQSRGTRRFAIFAFAVALVGLGFVVPGVVIGSDHNRTDIPSASVTNLTAAEKHGAELFGRRCALCHTLKASNAVAQVGPNLDDLAPNKALVLATIKSGRSSGNGQMPALIYQGQDAEDVAAYVAKAAGNSTSGG